MRVDTSDASTCARSSGQGSAAAAGAGRASAVHNTQAKRSFVVRTSVIVGASCGPVGSVMQSAAAIVHAATTMWERLQPRAFEGRWWPGAAQEQIPHTPSPKGQRRKASQSLAV